MHSTTHHPGQPFLTVDGLGCHWNSPTPLSCVVSCTRGRKCNEQKTLGKNSLKILSLIVIILRIFVACFYHHCPSLLLSLIISTIANVFSGISSDLGEFCKCDFSAASGIHRFPTLHAGFLGKFLHKNRTCMLCTLILKK